MTADLANSMGVGVPPVLLAVDLDTIIFLVVVIVSLLGRLFGKKEPEHAEEWIDGEDWDEAEKKRSASGETPPQLLDWEAEMRRLLEGREPEPKQASAPPPLPQEPEPAHPIIVPPAPAIPTPSEPSKLATAEEAYRKARELKAQAAARMAEVGHLPNAPIVRQRGRRSAEAQSVIDLLRGSKSARKAVIASVILSPAKGLR